MPVLATATTHRLGWAVSVPARVPCCASEVNSRTPEIEARTPVMTVEKTKTWETAWTGSLANAADAHAAMTPTASVM